MFEALAEFLPVLKVVVEWRAPAFTEGDGRQGAWVPFSADSFVAQQKSQAPSGGATLRPGC